MILSSPGNIAFSILGFDIYYYGILMAVAILSALLISNYVSKKYYDFGDTVLNLAPATILWSLIGARLYYCLLNFGYYSHHITEIINIREGGLSIHGAIVAGIIYLVYVSIRYNLHVPQILDIFSIGLPLGQAIGRWGNFFNSEAYGLPYNGFFKLYIAPEYRLDKYIDVNFYHPTFLYESFLDLVLFFIIFTLIKKTHPDGKIILIYLILYSVIRIFVEQFRIDATCIICGISFPIIISILIVVVCGFMLIRRTI